MTFATHAFLASASRKRSDVAGLITDPAGLVYTSGHYVEFDGVGDYASVTPTFPSAVADIELLARSTSDGSIPTTYGTGTFSANGTWQNVSITTPAKEYGDKMWFDGVNDYVSGVNFSWTSDSYVEFTLISGYIGHVFTEIADSNSNRVFVISSGTVVVQINNTTRSVVDISSIPVGTVIKIKIVRDGSTVTGYLNDELVATETGMSTISKSVGNIAKANSGTGIPFGTGVLLYIDFNGTIYSNADWTGGTVNGNPQTVTQYFSTNPLEIGRSGSDYFAGDVANVNFKNASGTIIGSWLMGSNDAGTLTGLPEFDRSGNGNHLTYTGCTSVVGEGLPVPQTGLLDWNKAINFNEAGSVSLGSGDPLGFSGASKIEFRGWVYVTGTIPTIVSPFFSYYVATGLSGFSASINNSGDIRVAGRSGSSDSFQSYTIGISDGWHYVKMYLNYANNEAGISIDDGTYNTSFLSFGQNVFTPTTNTNTNNIGEVESVSGAICQSIVRDVEILVDDVKTDSWTLYGINDLENKTGSVDGTVSGSPVENLLPSSLSNPAVDALGNPIADPRNNLLNHTGWDGDRAVIPYDPALNVTTEAEWFIWGNFYIDDGVAQTKRFVDRYDNPNIKRVFLFYRFAGDSASDGKCRINLSPDGSLVYSSSFTLSNAHSLLRFQYNGTSGTLKWAEYNNGSWSSLTDVTTELGSIPASIFSTDIPIYLPGTFNTSAPLEHWEGQQSPLFMYNRILTDSEADRVRRKTQSTYGE